MNLRDRMNSGSQGATPTEIGKKMDSSSITEKSSQQSKESIMQSQSETIRRQAQEIRLLSSENLMMKKKLQEQSETIVALNGADKVLQENRMLEKQNSELRKRASEAEAAAEAVKTSYKEKMEKAKKKLARAEELEQEAQKKVDEEDKRITDLADRMSYENLAGIDRLYREDRDRMHREYKLKKQECEERYKRRGQEDEAFTWGVVLFASLDLIFRAIQSARFSHDLLQALSFIGGFITGVFSIAWSLGAAAWSLNEQIAIPVIRQILPAVLAVAGFAGLSAFVFGGLGFIGYKLVGFYREHFADSISVYIAVTELVVLVWFADMMSAVKLNLTFVFIAVHFVYVFIRMVVTREGDGTYFGPRY